MNDFSAFRIIAAIALVTVSCVLFTSLPGCGHADPVVTAQVSSQASVGPGNGLGHAQLLSGEAQVVCAENSHCPENVGMVVAAFEGGVVRCSGALIGPDLVVTSSRCIPLAISSNGAACGERVRFLLPALNSGSIPAQQARCGELIGSADPAVSSYAFIRLAAPVQGRRPLALDTSGIQDAESFTVPVINPTSDTRPFGEVRVLKCKAYQRTAILPQFADDLSPVAALGGCLIGATAYGAPVLDQHGAIRAVIQSGTSPQDVQNDQLAYGPMLPNTQVEDFAFAANLACLQIPGAAPRALPASCVSDEKILAPQDAVARAVTPSVLRVAQAGLVPKIAAWQASQGQKLLWGFSPLAVSVAQTVEPHPACFANSADWLGSYRHWYTHGGYETDAELDLQIPRLRVEFDLSAVLQTVFSIQSTSADSVRLHFNPRDLAETGQSTVVLTSSANGAAIGGPLFLKACTR